MFFRHPIHSRGNELSATSAAAALLGSLGVLSGCQINKAPDRQTVVHQHVVDGRPFYPDDAALQDAARNVEEARRASQQLGSLFAVLEECGPASHRAAFHYFQRMSLAQAERLLVVENAIVGAYNERGSFTHDLQRQAAAAIELRAGARAELSTFADRYLTELGAHYGTSNLDAILERVAMEPVRRLEFSGGVTDPKSSVDASFLRAALWSRFLTFDSAGFFEGAELAALKRSGKARGAFVDFDRRAVYHEKEFSHEALLADEEFGRASLALYAICLANRHPEVRQLLTRFSSPGFSAIRGNAELDGEAFHQFRILYSSLLSGEQKNKWDNPATQGDMMTQVALWWGIRNIADGGFTGNESWIVTSSADAAARERDITAPQRIYRVVMHVPEETPVIPPDIQAQLRGGGVVQVPAPQVGRPNGN